MSADQHNITVDEPIIKSYESHSFVQQKKAGLLKRIWNNIIGDDIEKNKSDNKNNLIPETKNFASQYPEKRAYSSSTNKKRRPPQGSQSNRSSTNPNSNQRRKPTQQANQSPRTPVTKTDAPKKRVSTNEEAGEK
jgi:hypothetical protein